MDHRFCPFHHYRVALLITVAYAALWPAKWALAETEKTADHNGVAAPMSPHLSTGNPAKTTNTSNAKNGNTDVHVNVKEFSHLAVNGDWSPAIQAAIDHVTADNGYENGATIFFPPGRYLLNNKIVLGKDPAHYGTRLSGYGTVLVGTKNLDEQPLNYEERKKQLAEENDEFSLAALPGELDFEGENVGVPILELWNPAGQEGAAYTVEGLTFTRESKMEGVGIKIPAETVPKNVTFRDIKVHHQNVGVHINHCYQIRFESCIIRGNRIGLWGRNHFNSVSITNSTFRRQHLHGLVIGPNANQWGSSVIHIAGSIFEANKGYGILNKGGVQVAIVGNYFEANGNGIGILSPFGNTTVDTCNFWGFYGHGWKMNRHGGQVVSDKAHIILSSKNVHLRNNRYAKGASILIFGMSGKNIFDARPVVAEGVELPHGTKAADGGGLGAYLYQADTGNFVYRELQLPTEEEALSGRIRQAKEKLAKAASIEDSVRRINDCVAAQLEVGDILLEHEDCERARLEYQRAFQYPAKDQTDLRSSIQLKIADSYMKQKKYEQAVDAYTKAQQIGLGGWRIKHAAENLKRARELAREPGDK